MLKGGDGRAYVRVVLLQPRDQTIAMEGVLAGHMQRLAPLENIVLQHVGFNSQTVGSNVGATEFFQSWGREQVVAPGYTTCSTSF